MKWFVYDNTMYYPWACVTEADSAEAAAKQAVGTGVDGKLWSEGVAVFPLDALAWANYEVDAEVPA